MFGRLRYFTSNRNVPFLHVPSTAILILSRQRQLSSIHSTHTKRGYGLYSVLLSLLLTIMVVQTVVMMFMALSKLPEKNIAVDVAYAISKVTTLVNTSSTIEVNETSLLLNKEKTVSLHQSRLVVQPGFNIVLHDIDYVYFTTDGDDVYMTLDRHNQEGTYYVGTAYRPKERVCSDALSDESSSNASPDVSTDATD